MWKELKGFVNTWWTRAMTEPEVNSRIVFIVQGVTATMGMLVLVVAFVFAKDKAMYPYMVGTVMGAGGGLAAFGRAATKYVGRVGSNGKTDDAQ